MKSFFALIALCLAGCQAAGTDDPLKFNAEKYTVEKAEVNGQTITYRAYKGIVYVANPVDTAYQSLNFYVPTAYYEGKSLDGYTAETAPIFLPNNIGGYMPAKPGGPAADRRSGKPNAALTALSKGYVVASPGARGRTLKTAEGRFCGKAPAAIVDLKAAVRYLKHNDAKMPGDAQKIVSNGTSAGGAMSALLGGTGNSKDYEPHLKALGAAEAGDDIFAVSAYCPITNLDNADAAYEWQFADTREYRKMTMGNMIDFHMERKTVEGTMTSEQVALSARLKALFPPYVNNLKLKAPDGTPLTLNADGSGNFRDYVASFVLASAQKALDGGADLGIFDWLTIKNGKATAMNFKKYVQYTRRDKLPPAFDALDLSTGENDLFGTDSIAARHFTAFGRKNDTAGGKRADIQTVKLMNPMYYIGTKGVTTAKHWRIRHGTIDKDGSIAIPVILGTMLLNSGFDVDLALPWETPHSGDYDLEELFDWVKRVAASKK